MMGRLKSDQGQLFYEFLATQSLKTIWYVRSAPNSPSWTGACDAIADPHQAAATR
jgi:hypothetical protein